MFKRFTILMLLLYSFIGMARAEIVEIGTDGGTTTNNYLPAYTFYNYNLTEQIYTADEIGMAGTISSIAFYNGGEVKTPNLKIYMVNTDKDVFSNSTDWFTVTAADLVFEGSVTMTANAWTTITLTNEFQYDGNSNLGLIVDEYMQYNSGLACRVYTSTSNCSLYAYNDSNDYSPLSPPTSFGSYEYNGILSVKNQIKLEITPSGGSICEKPASLAVSEVTGNSATLTWSGGSGLYNVEYKKVSATQWSTALSNTTALTTNLTNLEAETAYQARVQSVCSDGTSSYRTVNFVVSDKITIGSGAGTSGYLPTNTNYDYSYTQQIYTVEELGAPGFIRSIDFYMTSTTTYTRTLDVYMVSTDKNSFSGTTDWISVTSDDLVFSGSVTFTADSWTTITLNDYGFLYDGTQNVAIIVDDNTNDWDSRYFKTFTTTTNQAHYAYQDDTNINPNAPTAYSNYVTSSKNQIRILKEDLNCMPPTNPTATEITATSAVVTWEGEAENYNISYIGTSYFENFENGLNDWTTYKEGDASSDGWYIDNPNSWEGSTTAHSGDYVAWSMQQSSGIHADNWLISRPLDLGGTLKFWVSRSNDNSNLDEYEVLLSTNGTAINDFTTTLQEMEVAPTRWTEVSIDLSAYEGQQGYIAIHHDYTNGFFLMIDDFGIYDWNTELVSGNSYTFNNLPPETQQLWKVQAICDDGESAWSRIQSFTTIPTCVAPTGLDVSNITAHSATFTWNAEEGATYRYVLPRNYNPSVDPESLSFNNRVQGGSVTIRNLNADTEYGFFLRRDCGETGYSDIVYVVFRTTVACPAPTDLTVVENSITGHGATLSWTGTSNSYIVNVGELESASTTYNFDNNSIDPAFTNSTTYPWTVTSNDKHSGNYSIKSGGAGTNNAQSDLTLIVNIVNDATVSFWSKVSSESTDYGRFLIDNNQKFQVSGTSNNWTQYSYELDPGTHTLVWRYYKDYSVHSGDDCFYVDDIVIGSDAVSSWTTFTVTESPFILYDAAQIHPETPYMVIIQGDCGSEGLSLETEPITFTTDVACPAPVGLTVTDITSNSATVTWAKAAFVEPDVVYFQYVWVEAGGNPDWTNASMTTDSWANPDQVPSGLANDLNHSTNYDFYVRRYCGELTASGPVEGGEYSEESMVSFKTACAAITDLPWSEDFNAYTTDVVTSITAPSTYPNHQLPNCWQFQNLSTTSSTYPQAFFTSSSAYAVSGKCLLLKSSNTTPLYVVLPEFEAATSDLQLTFTYRNGGTGTTNGTLYVGYMSDPTLDDTFVSVDTCAQTTTKTTKTIYFLDAPDSSYLVFKYVGGTNNNMVLSIDNVVVEQAPSCYPVNALSYTDPAATAVNLSWTLIDNTQTAWQVSVMNGEEESFVDANTNQDFLLEGLSPETEYIVKVRAFCGGNNFGEWSNTVTFTTPEACPTPTDITVANLTAVSADLSWEGSQDVEGYTVHYRTATGITVFFTEDFEAGIGGWTMVGCDEETQVVDGTFRFNYIEYDENPQQNLISPEISGITDNAILEFEYWAYSLDYGPETFKVGLSSTNNQVGSFNWSETITVNDLQHHTYQAEVPAGTKYVAIQCTSYNAYYLFIDNITIGFEVTAGEWQTATASETNTQLLGLDGGTNYEVQVRSNCTEDVWSETFTFTTLPAGTKVFVTAGEWGTASNWMPAGAPTIEETAILRASAIITGLAQANRITFDGTPTPTLTINDGGQLRINADITATVKKNFVGYGADNFETDNGYYLIAAPTSADLNLANSGLITTVNGQATYDLYSWNRTAQDQEWHNYRRGTFSMLNGTGYLYANLNDVEMSFTSNLMRSDLPINKTPDYDATAGGWNLYGNPFPCDAYLSTQAEGMAFYRLSGNTFVAATGAIAPMEGFFAQATASNQTFTISREAPAKHGQLNMSLNHDGNTIDNALIIFGEGQNLGKMSFRENSSKVYMPVEGKDYAAVFTGNMGEMPVSFKAEENGSFTLSFTNSNIEFSYLHLIDTLTGADIDLLQTPSYSFESSTTDNANRFKVVFATR